MVSSLAFVTIPLFVLSLPRSGSTLLQRILGRHTDVATGPEPTFLLSLFNMTSSGNTVANYDQRFTAQASEDFFASLGPDAFESTVGRWASGVYDEAADGARYFVDKTPKYHQIATKLPTVFPDAPMIMLWRNPLAIIASILDTWGQGRWNMHHFRLDLFDGLPRLIELAQQRPDRLIAVRYEDLVTEPERVVRRLVAHLDLEFDPRMIDAFTEVELVGRVQDPNVGRPGFVAVRADRVDRWKTTLANPLRSRWARRYLCWLGGERLAVMGYDLDDLLDELATIERSRQYLASDLIRMPYDVAYRTFELSVVSRKIGEIRSDRRPILAHK